MKIVRPATAALLLGLAAVALVLLSSTTGYRGVLATTPTPPFTCFQASESSENGPETPTDLTVTWSPYYMEPGIILDAGESIQWTDNSNNETCFVIEISIDSGQYETFQILPPNSTEYEYFTGYGRRDYRMYAATGTARSAYSNIDYVYAGKMPLYLPAGDLNCDSGPDAIDVLTIVAFSAAADIGTNEGCPYIGQPLYRFGEDWDWGDVNCDGAIDQRDGIALLSHLADLPYEQVEPCVDIGQAEAIYP